ncbi:hypothetical protein ABQ354_19615, partial [Citrobacter freundii]|uniref:hypothetical protein n=1 Tax=Citrobacter freundii TaxID=546 RepID=UPI003AAD5F95
KIDFRLYREIEKLSSLRLKSIQPVSSVKLPPHDPRKHYRDFLNTSRFTKEGILPFSKYLGNAIQVGSYA